MKPTLLLLLALAACGRAPRPAPLDNELTPAAVDYLVWTPDGTTWLDAAGSVRGRAPGVIVAAGGHLWTLASEDVGFPLRTCDEIDHDPMPPPSGAGDDAHGTVAAMRQLDGDARLALGDAPADQGFAQLDWGTRLLGSVGPYLFAETDLDDFGCGAHGNQEAFAASFNLELRAERAIVTPADIAPATPAAVDALGEALDAELTPADVHHAESRPIWRDGALVAQYLFWADACYACGNGEWSSYTSAVWVDAPELPRAFAALPAVPPAVAALATGDASGISWGAPTAAWQDAFGAP